jgi:TetR/AcrR family transcriptional regulator, regulator of cefoperazone and chloramphenicol sensitivity
MSPSSKADDTRQRLIQAALRLFARQGFARTSTRELAEAAHANVAAISYHFGDKAGLYRAVFFGPEVQGGMPGLSFADPALDLEAALAAFYTSFLEPLSQGEEMRLCVQLHFREMIEPTGLWQEEITHGIAPMHAALVKRLARHLGQPDDSAADDDLHRLAVCLTALAVHLHVGADIIDVVAPPLLQPAGLQAWPGFLTRCALAMVEAEARRRSPERVA